MPRFQVQVDPDLEAIMDRYMSIRFRELAELEQAIADHDSDTIRMLGHRLKGTGASYGFPRLTELGAAIEIAGKENTPTAAAPLTAEVRDYLENVDVIYGD